MFLCKRSLTLFLDLLESHHTVFFALDTFLAFEVFQNCQERNILHRRCRMTSFLHQSLKFHSDL
jgi:hypothetical protein